MKHNPRILMFAPFCYPPAGSEAIVTSKLVLAMISAGWEIDVICQPELGHFYPASTESVLDPAKEVTVPIAGNRVCGSLKNSAMPPHFQSVIWAFKAARAGSRLLSNKRYDFILSRATPLYAHLPALLLSKQSGLKWIANWSDPLPPAKAPPPYGGGPRAPLPPYLAAFCSAVAQNAHWHTFPCSRLKSYVGLYLPQIREKSSVVPHILLPAAPCDNKPDRSSFSLCHVGSLANRDVTGFLHALDRFCLLTEQAGETVTVDFVGTGDKALQQAVAVSERLRRIVAVDGPKSYEETQRVMASASVLVVIEARCEEGIFFPSKFVDCVQVGRPILSVSPLKGTLADILTGHGGGLAVDNRSPEAVFDGMMTLYRSWQAGALDAEFGSSHLSCLFASDGVLESYSSIFRKIS